MTLCICVCSNLILVKTGSEGIQEMTDVSSHSPCDMLKNHALLTNGYKSKFNKSISTAIDDDPMFLKNRKWNEKNIYGIYSIKCSTCTNASLTNGYKSKFKVSQLQLITTPCY